MTDLDWAGRLLPWALVLAIAGAGCASSAADDEGAGGSGSTGAGGAGNAPEPCVSEANLIKDNSGATRIAYLCDPAPSQDSEAKNACRNDSDCAVIATDQVRDIARVCGLGARGIADCDEQRSVNQQCVIEETKIKTIPPGLSPRCASCYADVAVCGTQFCLSECAADADAPECVQCQLKAGCRIPFEKCSGLERL